MHGSESKRRSNYILLQFVSFSESLQKIYIINPLSPELFFLILAHPVYKMWIIQEPNALELWNKLHFEEEKKKEITYHV